MQSLNSNADADADTDIDTDAEIFKWLVFRNLWKILIRKVVYCFHKKLLDR